MTYDCDYCILFGHHDVNPWVWHNYNLLVRHNPGGRIVPVTQGGNPVLPGTVDTALLPTLWSIHSPWRSADRNIYNWFLSRPFSARYYIWAEWDVHARCSFPDFFGELWERPVVGNLYIRPHEAPEWATWQEITGLPGYQQQYAAGIGPLACVKLSHEALVEIVGRACWADIFCELRLGTAICHAGLPVAQQNVKTMPGRPVPGLFTGAATIYHPLKKPSDAGILL